MAEDGVSGSETHGKSMSNSRAVKQKFRILVNIRMVLWQMMEYCNHIPSKYLNLMQVLN